MENFYSYKRENIYDIFVRNLDSGQKLGICTIVFNFDPEIKKLSKDLRMINKHVTQIHEEYANCINGLVPNQHFIKLAESWFGMKLKDNSTYAVSLIVELLSESDRLSILDIFGQLNSFFSSQSIYRALSMLQKEKMVRIDKKTDKNIFYQLNDEYFIIAKNEINKKMKCYIRKKRKEENFYEEMD